MKIYHKKENQWGTYLSEDLFTRLAVQSLPFISFIKCDILLFLKHQWNALSINQYTLVPLLSRANKELKSTLASRYKLLEMVLDKLLNSNPFFLCVILHFSHIELNIFKHFSRFLMTSVLSSILVIMGK